MITDIIAWWYGRGAFKQLEILNSRINATLQTFSIGLLLGTLFAPFRQIDAGGVQGPLDVMFRAWADRTFSRIFGFFVRSMTILVGLALIALTAIFGIVWLVLWMLIPILPLIGLYLTIIGYQL